MSQSTTFLWCEDIYTANFRLKCFNVVSLLRSLLRFWTFAWLTSLSLEKMGLISSIIYHLKSISRVSRDFMAFRVLPRLAIVPRENLSIWRNITFFEWITDENRYEVPSKTEDPWDFWGCPCIQLLLTLDIFSNISLYFSSIFTDQRKGESFSKEVRALRALLKQNKPSSDIPLQLWRFI